MGPTDRSRRRRWPAIATLAVVALCLVVSCAQPRAVFTEAETEGWRYSVETEHYTIHTNTGRELVEQAAVVAESAYAGAAKRLAVRDMNPAFIKTLERTFEPKRELVYTSEDGTKHYALPDGVILHEWPRDNTVYQLVLPDGRRFPFWEQAMYGRNVPVYLCKDKAELDECFPNKAGPGRGGWGPAAGVIAIILFYEEPYKNLDNMAHEIAHQIMSYVVYGPPVWLDEGLAMYAGVGSDGKYRRGIIRKRALQTCVRAVHDRTLMPVKDLVGMDYKAFHVEKEEWVHYAQSWALVHFLMHSDHPQIEGKLSEYITELRRGTDAAETFEAIFSPDLLDAEWPKYIEALGEKELQSQQRTGNGLTDRVSLKRRRAACLWQTSRAFRDSRYSTSVLSKMLYGSKTEIAPRSGRPM